MKCKWCYSIFPGQILIEEVCLACIVEDTIPPDFNPDEEPNPLHRNMITTEVLQ